LDPLLASTLRRMRAFQHLERKDLLALALAFRRLDLARDQPLYAQGQQGESLCLLAEGSLRAERVLADGRHLALGAIKPGELVGEMAVLDPGRRSATVTAAMNSVVFGLNRNAVDQLEESHPAVASALMAEIIRLVDRRTLSVIKALEARFAPAEAEVEPPQRTGKSVRRTFNRLWVSLTGAASPEEKK